jgi:hypothetical protein
MLQYPRKQGRTEARSRGLLPGFRETVTLQTIPVSVFQVFGKTGVPVDEVNTPGAVQLV